MTDRPEPEVVRAAGRLVDRLLTEAVVEQWESADFFVIECLDPEFGTRTLHGQFPTAAAATLYAERWEPELNRGMPEGENGFRCTVHPVHRFGDESSAGS